MREVALATLLLLGLSGHVCGASEFKQVWVIDASTLTGESPHLSPPEPIWGLAFSPDETQLAIGLGNHETPGRGTDAGHVVIVPVTHPSAILHRFGLPVSPTFPFPGSLAWAPSGKSISVYMGNAGVGVFSLDGKQVCGFPDAVRIAGFLSADRTVTEQERAGSGRSFEVHRADCGLEDTWRTPGRTTLGFATCPEAGLVAISWFSQPGGKPAGIDVLRDPGHGVIRQLAGTFGALGEGITFADSCRLICAGQRNDKGFANHATCWDIRTGETAVEARGVTFGGSWPSFDAAGGDLIASTVYQVNCHLGKFWEFIDEAGCGEPYKRLAIWNARDGRELFSLSPPEQLAGWKRGDGSQVTEPSAFTISPSHKFVAEGGSGRVRIFANQ